MPETHNREIRHGKTHAARAAGARRRAPIRMSDIADSLGLSRSTVSFVLNQKHDLVGISEETRQRVLSAAEAMGYRRNEIARAMVTGRSRILGFVIANDESEVFGRILAGAMEAAEEAGYFVKVFSLNQIRTPEALLGRCAELSLAGVMTLYVTPSIVGALRQATENSDLPLVVLDSSPPVSQGWHIMSDDKAGGREAIDHLVSLGHRRIALIAGPTISSVATLREQGYRAAMASHGVVIPDGYVQYGNWDTPTIVSAVKTLFQNSAFPRPTALFCADDITALVALRALRRLGLFVPHDVSVVGFADLRMAEFADPPLTTVQQPFREMGRLAVRLLIGETAPESREAESVMLPTQLVERESTATVPL